MKFFFPFQHARNGGEVKIAGHRVDGYCPETKTVYEYHGCAFHGCPRCFRNRESRTPFDTETMGEAYQATLDRARALRQLGYQLVEAWDCDVQQAVRDDRNMKTFFDGISLPEPLNPRHAFYGGRTNAVCLWKKCEAGEEIGYMDVCSL